MCIRDSGNILEFKPTDEGYLKLHKTWFCKSKLCPVCNWTRACLLYTSDAADDLTRVDLGGRRIIKKKFF
ncbi:hypothetical protein JMUB7535_26890 [Staphylococcus aureus]